MILRERLTHRQTDRERERERHRQTENEIEIIVSEGGNVKRRVKETEITTGGVKCK